MMQPTLICVAWTNGRWRVTESGPRNSIACFGERLDAMEYAKELAERTPESTLQVRNHELEPDWEAEMEARGERAAARSRLPRAGASGRRFTARS